MVKLLYLSLEFVGVGCVFLFQLFFEFLFLLFDQLLQPLPEVFHIANPVHVLDARVVLHIVICLVH